jgi:hypothetical protein
VEVKLGKPMLEDVGETAIRAAWGGQAPPPPGMPASGEYQRDWIDVVVGVELEPWPDHDWLTFWQEEDLDWPERFEEPVLDGRRLIFSARDDELQDAWDAVKIRVEKANMMYRGDREDLPEDDDSQLAEQESLRRLREAAQRRIDELD